MTLKNRRIWIGAIAIIALILISLFAAPRSNTLRDGSTYSRAPNGYGAWYTYMQEQGASIQRWQKPLNSLFQPSENSIEEEAVPIDYRPGQKVEKSALLNDGMKRFAPPMVGVGSVPILKDFGHLRGDAPPKNNPKFSNAKKSSSFILHLSSFPQSPITVLQIDNGLGWLDLPTPEWIEQGNVFVRLGIQSRDSLGRRVLVTEAPFTSVLSSPEGGVKIETSRRLTVPPDLEGEFSDLLKDVHGTVVWQETLGQGRLIFAVTSYLAANAYQDEPGNFQFLEQLVNESGYPIWVDEYIHGYKDQEIIAEEASGSLVNYLVKTPIAVIAVQVGIMLLVLIWGLNRRLGPAVAIADAKVDNSEAYIQALAAVLHNANCSEFVVETVGKAEQVQVQRSMGLGTDLLDPATILATWEQRTGRPATELKEMLSTAAQHRRLSEQELLTWLGKVQMIRQTLEE